jgi:hypothetical protein
MGGRLNYIEPEEGTGVTPFDELPPNESRHTSLLTPLEISMVQFAYRAASLLMTSRMIALPKARAALSSRSAMRPVSSKWLPSTLRMVKR